MNDHKRRLLIDFDGVIHAYSLGWHDGTIYDVPVEGAFDKLQLLYNARFEIMIFSTRCDSEKHIEEIKKWFETYSQIQTGRNWREFTFIGELAYTNAKLPALAYIDDRGIRFTNWEDIVKYFI